MTPSTQYALAALIMGLAALGFAWLSIWCARRALRMNAMASELATERNRYVIQLHEAWGMVDHWRIECELAEADATKWRLARAARRRGNKAKSQALANLKAQTTNALAEGK